MGGGGLPLVYVTRVASELIHLYDQAPKSTI